MFSTINAGLRLLGCGLLLTFVISIADSLWTGTLCCRNCEAPMRLLEDMEFHSIKIRVFECTRCGNQWVEHLRPDGKIWKPGVPAAGTPSEANNGSAMKAPVPVGRAQT